MRLVGLPGRNPETEAWMGRLTASVQYGQEAVEIAHYSHWDSGGDPDVSYEASRIQLRDDDLVIAKSMGTMVLLTAAVDSRLPARAVFIGTPIGAYPNESVDALRQFGDTVPSLFIQQTDDFTGSYSTLEGVTGALKCTALVEVEGHDHVYGDIEGLKRIIDQWWTSRG